MQQMAGYETVGDMSADATVAPVEKEVDLSERRREFNRYASAKNQEIEEFRLAHRYYSSVQWTAEEVAVLRRRGQPVITFDRVSRKINGVVGTLRRLRTDPKASPRRPEMGEAAELATHVVRYLCDAADFENIEGEALLSASIIGYAGLEMSLTQGDQGDPDVGMLPVDSRTFFYDPRSVRPDFSDARFMGTYKWVTPDEVEEIAPGFGEQVKGAADGTFSTQAETDRDDKWVDELGRVKLVDHWYIEGGKWHWCLHTGSIKIAGGESPFFDELGKSVCKFRMWSAYVDHEGDRYGFVRSMKGPQDAINQHRSKAMHIMNTRQVKVRQGAIADLNKLRTEAARPDGVIEYAGSPDEVEIIQPAQEFLQQTQYFQDAKDEIENFGPNQALLGTEMKSSSGRAIALMQQSGLAELGPFLKNYRMWKLDVFKLLWATAKRYWQAERWLRVTGNENAANFVSINQLQLDQFGRPIVVNQIGAIDVDIILEEGPDTENVQGDVYDALQAMANNNMPVPPQVIIEMSALPSSVKEKVLSLLEPKPDPAQEAQQQALIQQEVDKALKLQAETFKIMTEAMLNKQKMAMGGDLGMQAAKMQADGENRQLDREYRRAERQPAPSMNDLPQFYTIPAAQPAMPPQPMPMQGVPPEMMGQMPLPMDGQGFEGMPMGGEMPPEMMGAQPF